MQDEKRPQGEAWEGEAFMRVMQVASAYWNSRVLHTAVRFDVFTRLEAGPATAEELAQACGADPRGLEILLIACTALGFLQRDAEGRYTNTSLASTYLVQGKERCQTGIVAMFDDWYLPWGDLPRAVETGGPVVQKPHDISEEATRHYIMGMHHRAVGQAQLLAESIDLSQRRHLLDVAGGPGTFTIFFCKRYPHLRGKVLDLPQTLRITREIIREFGMEDRVETREGDYLQDASFGSGYDVALLSSMMNQESPETNRQTFRKVFEALEPGGLLILQEQMLNEDKTGPLLSALIGVNQLIHTPGGAAWSIREITSWLEEVGFQDISRQPLAYPSPFTVLTARRP